MKKVLLLAIILILPTSVYATSQSGVEIVYLNVNRPANQVFIRTSTPPVSNGCHTDTNWSYTFRLSSEADQAVYSMLLAAKLAGKTVDMVGYGDCFADGGGTIEELQWVTLSN